MFCFVIFLICYDYFDVENTYLTTEIIIVLIIGLVIVCIDSFDFFQIGNLLNMKKEKNLIEKENKTLREQNLNLTKLIANINNNISINLADVKPATEEEKKLKASDENIQQEGNSNYRGNTEFETLNKYIKLKHYEQATIIREAKIDLYNASMRGNIVFDLYIKQGETEEFVEVKRLNMPMYGYHYISKQLFLIERYNQINHANAKYVLILGNQFGDEESKNENFNKQKYEQLLETFKAPIEKGLMSVLVL